MKSIKYSPDDALQANQLEFMIDFRMNENRASRTPKLTKMRNNEDDGGGSNSDKSPKGSTQ